MPLIDPPRQSGQESAHGAGRRRPAGRPPEAAALRDLEDAEILAARRHSMHEENLLPPTKRGERPSTQRGLDRPGELVLVAAEPPAFGHEGAGLGSTARGDLEEQPEALLVLLRLQDDVQGKGQPIDDHQRRRLRPSCLRTGRRCRVGAAAALPAPALTISSVSYSGLERRSTARKSGAPPELLAGSRPARRCPHGHRTAATGTAWRCRNRRGSWRRRHTDGGGDPLAALAGTKKLQERVAIDELERLAGREVARLLGELSRGDEHTGRRPLGADDTEQLADLPHADAIDLPVLALDEHRPVLFQNDVDAAIGASIRDLRDGVPLPAVRLGDETLERLPRQVTDRLQARLLLEQLPRAVLDDAGDYRQESKSSGDHPGKRLGDTAEKARIAHPW